MTEETLFYIWITYLIIGILTFTWSIIDLIKRKELNKTKKAIWALITATGIPGLIMYCLFSKRVKK